MRQPLANNGPRGVRFAAALMGAVAMTALPAFAQNSPSPAGKLQDVERKILSQQEESAKQKARADALKAEMDAVTADLIAAAKRAQDQEFKVIELEGELAGLEREADLKTEQLRERRQQFSGVVMALSRIARFPAEALVAQPIPPEDTVRSAILLRAAVPAIESRAASLKDDLHMLADARADVAARRTDLQGALEVLRAEEGRIEAIRKQKAAMRAEAISKSRAAKSQAQRLGREANNLRELMASIEKNRKAAQAKAESEARAAAQNKAPSALHVQPKDDGGALTTRAPNPQEIARLGGIGSISKARGQLPFPAVGKLVGLYGQQIEGGLTRKGVSIETRDGAQVIAPFDGQVVFAGPFRGYGQLLIIDHGEGYHSLLAGLGRIDAIIGQPVLAGEPLAQMTGSSAGASGEAPLLYVEFRRDNRPINPLPWLASRKGTPKG